MLLSSFSVQWSRLDSKNGGVTNPADLPYDNSKMTFLAVLALSTVQCSGGMVWVGGCDKEVWRGDLVSVMYHRHWRLLMACCPGV